MTWLAAGDVAGWLADRVWTTAGQVAPSGPKLPQQLRAVITFEWGRMEHVKTRMTSLDIRAAVNELRRTCVHLRLANVYDVNISRRVYLLKFAASDQKHYVLIESGVRFHTTVWKRSKNVLPSCFTMRLRKYLRTRRLEAVQQIGADRVIDFVFGTSQKAMHLIVEFYVSVGSYFERTVIRLHSRLLTNYSAIIRREIFF